MIAAVSASHGSARPRVGAHGGERPPERPEVPAEQQADAGAAQQRRDQRLVAGPLGVAQRVHRLPLRRTTSGPRWPAAAGGPAGAWRARSATRYERSSGWMR